jgi:glycosyltransferase involved in cell wall biosynthesis
MSPKISVLIPTYRYARFLQEAIDSVLVQDFEDYELLISDDASGDGSAEIIHRCAASDPRIRFHIHEHCLGMVANWNWCLREARGEYIKFLFGDDRLMSPSTLRRMAAILDAEPRAVIAASARAILDENSNQIEIWDDLGPTAFHRGADVLTRCLGRDKNLIGEPSAVLFRRAAADRGFNPAWRQLVDQEMWFHLLMKGDLVYDQEPLCGFRRHESQQTEVNRSNRIGSAESLFLLGRYFDFFAASIRVRPNSMAMRRFLFRYLYYSKKNSQRDGSVSPALIAAEVGLEDRLGRGWYFIFWLIHRFTVPFINARRSLRKRLGRALKPPPTNPLEGRRNAIIGHHPRSLSGGN